MRREHEYFRKIAEKSKPVEIEKPFKLVMKGKNPQIIFAKYLMFEIFTVTSLSRKAGKRGGLSLARGENAYTEMSIIFKMNTTVWVTYKVPS